MPAVLEGTTPALEDALMVDDAKKRRLTRRKSGGDVVQQRQAGRQKQERAKTRSPARARKRNRRLLQKHHTADGHHHQAVSEDRTGNEVTVRSHLRHDHQEHDVVMSTREQTRRYNEGVQAAGKGHKLGPPWIWAWGGLIAGLQKQGAAVGAANAATPTGHLLQLNGMSMDTKCDHARFCRVDRTYQSEQARITLAVDKS